MAGYDDSWVDVKGDGYLITGATRATRLAIDVTNVSASRPTTVHGSDTVTGGKGRTNVPVAPRRGQ